MDMTTTSRLDIEPGDLIRVLKLGNKNRRSLRVYSVDNDRPHVTWVRGRKVRWSRLDASVQEYGPDKAWLLMDGDEVEVVS